MGDWFDERLPAEVSGWVDEGVISAEQGEAILDRYPDAGSPTTTSGPGWASALLYATAGILLGAAAIAFVHIGLDPSDPSPVLFATGLVVAGSGAVLRVLQPARSLLAEAVLVAGFAPLAGSVFGDPTWLLGLVAIGVPVASLVWLRRSPFVPTLAVVAGTVTIIASMMELLPDDQATSTILVGQLCLAGLVVVLDQIEADLEQVAAAALAVVAVAVALALFLAQSTGLDQSEVIELVVGGAMALVLWLGIGLGHRGVVVGGATALSVDAIVFAFDVNIVVGIAVLVGLAGVFIWQADRIKNVVASSR